MARMILTNNSDSILTLTFNRAEKKNALTHAMYTSLADALFEAREDKSIRVVVLTGSGDSFSAGNDLMDFSQNPPLDAEAPVMRFLRALIDMDKPVVAAVNGLAVGIGMTMLLHCDLVYATPLASFQAPFVNLALVPEAASSLLLPRLMGHGRAAEIFLLGRRIDAHEALAAGLVTRIVKDGEVLDHALAQAKVLAAKPPNAVRITKTLMRMDSDDVKARLMLEADYFGKQLQSAELKEAIAAFFDKRPAKFE